MTEEEIRELYEERLAIMLEGNSKDIKLLGIEEMNKRLTRAAYFDTRKQVDGQMPKDLWPDKDCKSVQAMRTQALHIDFGFLAGSIKSNPKAMPSNIDGMIERHGRFLVLEFKKPDEAFGLGQRIMLERLATVKQFEVWVITGHFDCSPVVFISVERILPNGLLQQVALSFDEFVRRLNAWHDSKSCYNSDDLGSRRSPF